MRYLGSLNRIRLSAFMEIENAVRPASNMFLVTDESTKFDGVCNKVSEGIVSE